MLSFYFSCLLCMFVFVYIYIYYSFVYIQYSLFLVHCRVLNTTRNMNGVAAVGGGGGGGRVSTSIPSHVRKTIHDIREITGKQHSDDEIYAVLKECSMDPDETAQKLLYLGIHAMLFPSICLPCIRVFVALQLILYALDFYLHVCVFVYFFFLGEEGRTEVLVLRF